MSRKLGARPRVNDSGDVVRSLQAEFTDRKDGSPSLVEDLLEFADDALGPDVALLLRIHAHGLAHLTKGRARKNTVSARSTPAFERRFGCRFAVTVDRSHIGNYYFDFLASDDWA